MRRLVIVVMLIGFIVAGFGVCVSYAGEIDILLQKLVEKGVLTAGEAQQIGTETKEQVRKEIAQGKNESLPTWVQTIKLKGDFRLRGEFDRDKGMKDDTRGRVRVRLGAEAKPNEQMKVGFGIATGKTSDPRSTNVNIGTSSTANTPGSFKDITLDYAYADYNPLSWLTLTGGKFKNPLWQPNDLLWDTDINPEGLAAKLNYNAIPEVQLYLNNLYYVLRNDDRNTAVSSLIAVQPGIKWDISPQLNLNTAVAGYLFTSLKDKGKFAKRATNALDAQNDYKYNYNSINPSVELGIKEPLGGLIPYVAFFSDGIYNYDPSERNTGYDAGIKLGYEKVEAGTWHARFNYAKLGRESWLDIFPDSDRYSGKTNMKAYEGILEYGFSKNSNIGLDYYYAWDLTETADGSRSPAQVLQADWNFKF